MSLRTSNNWAPRKGQEPPARAGHLAFDMDFPGHAVHAIVGGYGANGPMKDVWMHKSGKWNNIFTAKEDDENHPLSRMEYSGCILGNEIFILGGMFIDEGDQVSILNDLWSFNLTSKTWKMITEESTISERCNHLCVPLDDDRFVVHGGDCMGPLGDLWLYQKSNNTWSTIPFDLEKCPPARYSHSGCLWHRSAAGSKFVVVFGGLTVDALHMNDIWLLNVTSPDANDWTWHQREFSPLAPSPRDSASVVVIDGTLLIFGGFGLVDLDDDEEEEEEDDVDNNGDSNGNNDSNDEKGHEQDMEEPPITVFHDTQESAISQIGEKETEGEENVMITYLNDFWSINLESMDSTCLSDEGAGSMIQARRGACLMKTTDGNNLNIFGGFEEEHGFFGMQEIGFAVVSGES